MMRRERNVMEINMIKSILNHFRIVKKIQDQQNQWEPAWPWFKEEARFGCVAHICIYIIYNIVIYSENIIYRGIPTYCIQFKAIQDKITGLGSYKSLYKGNVTEFDLANNLIKLVCKHNKDHTVSNVTKFIRKTQFVRDETDKVFIN